MVCGRDYELVPIPFFGTWQEVEESLKQHIFKILRHNYTLFWRFVIDWSNDLGTERCEKKMNKKNQ